MNIDNKRLEKAKSFKSKWKMLSDCLAYEIKATLKTLKTAKKNEDFEECLKQKASLLTLQWIEEELESIGIKNVIPDFDIADSAQ